MDQNQPSGLWSFGLMGRREPAKSQCCKSVIYSIPHESGDEYFCPKCRRQLRKIDNRFFLMKCEFNNNLDAEPKEDL